MRKQIFFVLVLAIAGIASVNAQMRIGGEETPNKSAVLDLNPDDNVSAGNATLGLALPRVNLRNSGDAFPLLSHVKGMTVYNMATVGDVKPGAYVNNGAKWLWQADRELDFSVLDDSIINLIHGNELDGVIGNEVTNATDNGGLLRSGTGTSQSPYTLGIANSGVTTAHLANNAITSAKIADGTITNADINASAAIALTKIALPDATVNNGKVLKSNGTAWVAGDDNNTVSNTAYTAGNGLTLSGTTFSIGAGQVNGTMIADGAVSTADIADNAVTSAKLANNSVTSAKITDNAITTRHIENQSITMEKLSSDVVNEILMHGGGMMPPERPNSILVSNNNWQWRQQQIPGEQIIISYQWNTAQPAGWIDLGYALQDVPAGLYAATVQISQGSLSTSQVAVDCAVLEAGTSSAYSLISKQMDAFKALSFNESCIIYKLVPNNQVRLLVHTTQNTNYGLAAITLRPLIQLN